MQDDKHTRVEIIGFDSGWGCKDFRCEDGPASVRADALLLKLRNLGIDAKWRGPLGLKFLGNHAELDTKEKTLPLVLEGVRRLCNHVKHAVSQGHIPIVIGGDHSSAIGTWAGAAAGAQAFSHFGLIWLDSHLDGHTNETSWQGKWGGWWHGQPVTALTGSGLPDFRAVGGMLRKIDPRHFCIIGPHSFEPAEEEYVKKNKIRVFYHAEVLERGFKAVFDEAVAIAATGTKGFGLSIDLDAFQPSDAPGVGSLEEKGLDAAEVLNVMESIGRHPLFRALEIAEFNPHKDIENKTRNLIEKIVESIFRK